MEKNRGGAGENTHELEKNAKMLEKINTIILRPIYLTLFVKANCLEYLYISYSFL